MASVVSFSNVHQLSTSDKLISVQDIKKDKSSPIKDMLASPDSTNNNTNIINNNMMTSFTSTTPQVQQQRGRGRKSATTFVQVIPGQPVAVARRNARERNRVKQVNNGFSNLRQHIPFSARNKKMSKVETLKCAVEYIRSLQRLLDENGGYDGPILEHVTSSSPMSSLDSGEEHSLMSMSASEIMYESPTDNTVPTSSSNTVLLGETDYNDDFNQQLRHQGVILPNTRLYGNNDVLFDDSPLPIHPNNTLIQRHGSSLSPGYSDRSSNSPATEVVTTTHGFMGVFAAAAAGLVDKNSAGLMMDLSRNPTTGALHQIFKKEKDDHGGLLELQGMHTPGATAADMMDTITWWELEQARRIQQQASS